MAWNTTKEPEVYYSQSKGVYVEVDDMSDRWVRNAFKKMLRNGAKISSAERKAVNDARTKIAAAHAALVKVAEM